MANIGESAHLLIDVLPATLRVVARTNDYTSHYLNSPLHPNLLNHGRHYPRTLLRRRLRPELRAGRPARAFISKFLAPIQVTERLHIAPHLGAWLPRT